MQPNGLDAVYTSAQSKLSHFRDTPARYFVAACMAGCFCAIGMALAYTTGGAFYATESLRGAYKLILGGTFTLSFTMILFAGAELFTGNVLVFTMSSLDKRVKVSSSAGILLFCYFANLVGAAVMGSLIALTGLLEGDMGDLLVLSADNKMQIPIIQGFLRGVMCNILVCLGIWCTSKMQSETGKLIVLFWVVLGFAAPGYEHSIANMAIFAMAALAPQASGGVTFAGVLHNMVPVSIGNLVGGAVFVGWVYWFIGHQKKEQAAVKR